MNVLDHFDSTDDSINESPPPSLSCSNNMYTTHLTSYKKKTKRNKKKLHCYITHHERSGCVAVGVPHSTQVLTSTKRVPNLFREYLQAMYKIGKMKKTKSIKEISLVSRITRGKFTQRRPSTQTYHRCKKDNKYVISHHFTE